jgi:hypothetical protein
VKFASTHFQHGNTVKIGMRAKDENDQWWPNETGTPWTSEGVEIYNVGRLFVHGDFIPWSGASEADAAMRAAKHSTSTYSGSGWSPANVYAGVAVATALQIETHGFADPDESLVAGNGNMIVNSTLEYWRNASSTPPINVALIYACSAASQQELCEAVMAPVPMGQNRALVGFNTLIAIGGAQAASEAFWGALEDQYTVGDAVTELWTAYNEKVEIKAGSIRSKKRTSSYTATATPDLRASTPVRTASLHLGIRRFHNYNDDRILHPTRMRKPIPGLHRVGTFPDSARRRNLRRSMFREGERSACIDSGGPSDLHTSIPAGSPTYHANSSRPMDRDGAVRS